MKLDEGTLIGNRFRLVRILGRGGMGSVWLADHLTLGVSCALKFIEGEAQHDASTRARFEREARMAAQLKSAHVVQVLDYGVCDGTPYIAMEFLQGENLASRLERVGRLDPAATYAVIAQIARGLSKAHAAGIVHRDLKPENIFLAQEDDGENAKILDFGIAKLTAFPITDMATKTGTLFGTPFYMSPEQARGTRKIDHRSDLWSLAIMTFQCITGHLPFSSDALGDLLAQIIFDPIPMPSTFGISLPPGFDVWWARAASREPEGRFESAKQLADTLAEALSVRERLHVPSIVPRAPAPSLSDAPRPLLHSSIPPPPPWIVTPPAARAAAHRELLDALAAPEPPAARSDENVAPASHHGEASALPDDLDLTENPFKRGTVREALTRIGSVLRERRHIAAFGAGAALVILGALVALRPHAGPSIASASAQTASPPVMRGEPALAPLAVAAVDPKPAEVELPARPLPVRSPVSESATTKTHPEKATPAKRPDSPKEKAKSEKPRRPKAASVPDFGI